MSVLWVGVNILNPPPPLSSIICPFAKRISAGWEKDKLPVKVPPFALIVPLALILPATTSFSVIAAGVLVPISKALS